MDKEKLPFSYSFDFCDFCKHCPEFSLAYDMIKDAMGNTDIIFTCDNIDKCRRLKHILTNKK